MFSGFESLKRRFLKISLSIVLEDILREKLCQNIILLKVGHIAIAKGID
jgi:hypothetical protein